MDIVEIISKYRKQPESTSLPPIDGGALHSISPTPPKHAHKPRTPSKKINLIQQPLYFLKPHEKPHPDHRKYSDLLFWRSFTSSSSHRAMDLLTAADFARGDCAAPNIECWPLGTRTHSKDETEQGNNRKQAMRPEKAVKPLLLQQLEAFLTKELSFVGAAEMDENGRRDEEGLAQVRLARLQVFRECFLLLIEDFTTYQPLLLRIKAEYEALIDIYTLKVSKIPQYEATIRTMEQEAQHVISERNLVNKMKVKALKKQLKSTQAMLTSYAAANAHLEDMRAKLTTELEEQTKRLTDVMATNQTLLHSMKRQDERQKQHDSQLSELHGVIQNVTTKYTRAQDEISELRSSILMLEEKAGGIDVSADRATINHLTREVQDLLHTKALYEKLVGHHSAQHYLKRIFISAAAPPAGPSTNESSVLERLVTSMSAQGLSDVFVGALPTTIDGFAQGLSAYLATKSGSVFVTQATLRPDEPEELTSTIPAVATSPEYFVGKGTDASVPEYLHFDGRVRNLFYTRRDVEHWILDIWQQKDMTEKLNVHGGALATARKRSVSTHHASFLLAQSHQTLIPLRQYFPTYLAKKFPHRADAVECAYNVCEALEQFNYLCECRVFQLTLRGEVPEATRLDELQVVYTVHEAYATLEKNEGENIINNKRKGLVSVGGAMRELRILFPWKSEAAIGTLCKTLLYEAKGALFIPYTPLLEPDRHGSLSSFCECLRSQHRNELIQLKKLLLNAIQVAEKLAGPDSKGMISLDALRQAIKSVDPDRSAASTNAVLAECTTIPLERLENESATLVSGASVRTKLLGILIKPSGRIPTFEPQL
ncbi:hypothetical protein ACHHYP_17132 [Achlya hypogyna]|uniref:Translin-associated factor X-interacting protein 1 N-terminal domain-containing protein n=1 Tax=Achlya hypogyna TaxID=1202772 RepID=A0A1V9Y553_ACHHY|nr:hypothetical protein ACHHYP_17132 [Achlya hypogyna]